MSTSLSSSNAGLREEFAAMVAELRPKWQARDERRNAAIKASFARAAIGRPAPRVLTVDDYRAALRAYDSTAYLSDDREVARAGQWALDSLQQMAKQFDPDRSIWREVESNRRFA